MIFRHSFFSAKRQQQNNNNNTQVLSMKNASMKSFCDNGKGIDTQLPCLFHVFLLYSNHFIFKFFVFVFPALFVCAGFLIAERRRNVRSQNRARSNLEFSQILSNYFRKFAKFTMVMMAQLPLAEHELTHQLYENHMFSRRTQCKFRTTECMRTELRVGD